MSALSTAAILGIAAATGGAQIASAAIQHHATGEALDAQTAAAARAQAVNSQVYQDQKTAAQPYQQIGNAALGRLGSMPQNAGVFDPSKSSVPPPQMPQQSALGMMSGLGGGQAAPGMADNEPTVKLQAPDGSVRAFPKSQAQAFIQRGAKVVG